MLVASAVERIFIDGFVCEGRFPMAPTIRMVRTPVIHVKASTMVGGEVTPRLE